MNQLSILVALIFTAKMSFAQYDPKALEILDGMSKKYKAFTAFEANLSVTLTNDVEKIKEEFKGKIAVKGNKYKLSLPEQEVINNGTTIWTYLPDAKEVNIDNVDAKADEVNPSKFYEIYKKGFKYIQLEDQTEAGTLCHVVDLQPMKRDAQYFNIRMNISKKDKSVLSFTMFDKSGNRYKYTISKFIANAKIDDTAFAFDAKKYPGVEVVDLR
jgi:outer membrane lipoprotein carrier protein